MDRGKIMAKACKRLQRLGEHDGSTSFCRLHSSAHVLALSRGLLNAEPRLNQHLQIA